MRRRPKFDLHVYANDAVHKYIHLFGLFPLETWRRLLSEVGFEVKQVEIQDEGGPTEIPLFVCFKPL